MIFRKKVNWGDWTHYGALPGDGALLLNMHTKEAYPLKGKK